MRQDILHKLKLELIKEDFNSATFFEGYTNEQLDEVKLIAEQLDQFSKVLLSEAVDLARMQSYKYAKYNACLLLENLLKITSYKEDTIVRLIEKYENNEVFTKVGLTVRGIPIALKAARELSDYYIEGLPAEIGEIFYKPLLLVQHNGKDFTFTYNINNKTLAYTANFSEIRYDKPIELDTRLRQIISYEVE